MNKIKFTWAVTAILLVQIKILASPLESAMTLFDSELKWKTITTKHFYIHFHQGLKNPAIRLSKIAEKVHQDLTKRIDWQPERRTDVVLVDNLDQANGFATPFPYNKIQIYISRPKFDSVLNNFNDWLEIVFTHEYTHILNIDTVHQVPETTRFFLGRSCFPNLFLPIWALEGNALYHESYNGIEGRNNSTYAKMIIRTEVLYDQFKNITLASTYPREWPMGNIPYLYGGLFVEFLEKKYGQTKFADFFHENADNIVPYSDNIYPGPFFNKDAKDIYGKSFSDLWEEFKIETQKGYKHQLNLLKKEGLTYCLKISDPLKKATLPKFSQDGQSIYYVQSSSKGPSTLIKFEILKGTSKKLCSVNHPNSLSVGDNETIYLTDLEFYQDYSLYYELYKYQNNEYKQKTSKFRGSCLNFSSKKNQLIFTKNKNDYYSLIISDPKLQNQIKIIDQTKIQLASPTFSPNGKWIVFAIKDQQGFIDLVLYNLRSKKFKRLTCNSYKNFSPTWHPDGERIIFVSDKNGVYNLYEYNLKKGETYRLTNFSTGAFSPQVSPDGKKIVFSIYGARGQIIALLNYPLESRETEKNKSTDLDLSFFNYSSDDIFFNTDLKIDNYNPWGSLKPALFIPLIASEEIYPEKYDISWGIWTLGSDTLYEHSYSFSALIHQKQKLAEIESSYSYRNLTFGYYNNSLFWGEDDFPWSDKHQAYLKRKLEKYAFGGILIPFIKYNFQHILQFSYIYEKNTLEEYYPLFNLTSKDKVLSSRFQGVYSFNSTKNYPYSISPEDGRTFLIITDFYQKKLGSDYSYLKTRGELTEYLPGLKNNNVLMFRGRAGFSINNPSSLSPYSLGKFTKGETKAPSDDEDQWGLRGFSGTAPFADKLLVATAAYRFPLLQLNYGYKTFPLTFKDLWLNPFTEVGNVWDNGNGLTDLKSNLGIELHTKLTIGYRIDLAGYLGWAKGFGDRGENQLYFAISTFSEGAFKDLPHKIY